MAYPVDYERLYDYAGYQNANPTRPLPGTRVNLDLNDVQRAISEIIATLRGVTRSDGALSNGSVGLDQLSSGVIAGIEEPTAWAAGVDYTTNSTVFYGAVLYRANVDHTSDASFDAAKWDELADLTAVFDSLSDEIDGLAERAGVTPENYGAAGDTVRVASSAVTVGAGGTALTVVGASFTSADVGKVITIQGAGTAGVYHTTTIAARVSATQVTLTLAAVTALAGVAKEVIYGTDDTAAFTAAAAAMNAGTVARFTHKRGSKYLVLPSPTSFQILMDLTSGASGVTYDGNGIEMIVAGDPGRALFCNFMKLSGVQNFTVRNFKGTAVQGYSTGNPGLSWFNATGAVNNLSFNVDLTGGFTGVDCVRDYQSGDTVFGKNVTVTGKIVDITYGVQNRTHINGLFVHVDTDNNLRSFIMYGNTGPTEFTLRSKNPKSNDLDLVAYGYNTDAAVGRLANVRGVYINVDSTTDYGNINLTHQQADPVVNDIATVIENVDITFYFNWPLAGANGSPLTNESWAGHSGATSRANCAHVERNIVFRGEFRGLALNAPMFQISTAANGWGVSGDTHWIFVDISIPNAASNPFLIGQYAKTTFRNVRAPNLAKPTFDSTPAAGLNSWFDYVFSDANFAASQTGQLQRTGGLSVQGTNTNDSASAGYVGEYVATDVTSPVSLTTATPANLTTGFSLTAGDWDVTLLLKFNPNGSTTVSDIKASLSTTSATQDTTHGRQSLITFNTATPFNAFTMAVPCARFSLSGTTTVYPVITAGFAVSTLTVEGIVHARRVR